MYALAILVVTSITLRTGELSVFLRKRTLSVPIDSLSLRRPENCAHTAVTQPTADPPPITYCSPGPYRQLNSGTVVLNPETQLAAQIKEFLFTCDRVSHWKFPDQDLLSEFFKDKWVPISWYFNALRSLSNVHTKMWKESEIRCLHYIFADKPWQSRVTPPGSEKGFDVMDSWWWDRFDRLGEIMSKDDPEGWKLVQSTVGKGHWFA